MVTGFMLVAALSASIGGMMTPGGAAPNLISIGLLEGATGTRIGFVTWVALCFPIAAVMMLVLLGTAVAVFP